MEVKDLVKKYGLKNDDCWLFERKDRYGKVTSLWIIKHEACEKIATMEDIKINEITIVNSEHDFVRLIINASKGEKTICTIGEASKDNCKSNYYGCMAEKRGIDRAILKLINAYEYGIYSENESDDFENNQATSKDVEKITEKLESIGQPNSEDVLKQLHESNISEAKKIDLEKKYYEKPEGKTREAFGKFILTQI